MDPFADAEAALTDWERTADGVHGRFVFGRDLPVFIGHFPGNPLVPGVHQLAAVAILGRRAISGESADPPERVLAIPRCKWTAPVRPGDVLEVSARWQPQGDRWQIDGAVAVGGTATCSCRLILGR
ncbi:hypothetical protein LBMAG53_02400 [Planctomycetota bacterium]|nr:hypothetical protein LBMAG53_02400 [Planctomycetota bacterium]